jgi:hypothetical protein
MTVTTPYYDDGQVQLWHGDCRELTAWLTGDVLVTDPPYGIGWTQGEHRSSRSRMDRHQGIANDHDTAARDAALALWGPARPGLVFGAFAAPAPSGVVQTGVYLKPADAGLVGSVTGWRRDLEPIYLVGGWPKQPARWSSLVAARGGRCNAIMRTGHPHTKPLDVMEALVDRCPPGVIADPFAGSGSTLVAARNLGRRAVGVELDERYCETIAKRLAQDCLRLEA